LPAVRGEMTRYLGIIGYPLGHSLSPVMQQAALDYHRLDVRYVAWETLPDALAERVESLRRPENLGANVTVPHKEAVLARLDEVAPLARRIGAVNTIVKSADGDRLVGHNTDAAGFIRALRDDAGFDPAGAVTLLLGAGGAARAVVFGLVDAGVGSLVVTNRSLARARALVRELEGRAVVCDWAEREVTARQVDLIVNATSLGMAGGPAAAESPLAAAAIGRGALVYDLVYNPQTTPLLREAARAGARTLGGLAMLVYQGAAAFRLWTGLEPPLDMMRAAAQRALADQW
jgi:shikimate dehydrogenase